MGQLVTPQNRAAIPEAAHKEGESPTSCPITQPKVAPIQKEGTISPPRKPAFMVIAVRISFHRKSKGRVCPSSTAFSMSPFPAPIKSADWRRSVITITAPEAATIRR